MLSPHHIKWNDISSMEKNLITEVSFDYDEGEVETFLNREAVSSESYDGSLKRTYYYKWSDVFAPTITFIKKDFSEFTYEENREMLKWLTKSKRADYLEISRESNYYSCDGTNYENTICPDLTLEVEVARGYYYNKEFYKQYSNGIYKQLMTKDTTKIYEDIGQNYCILGNFTEIKQYKAGGKKIIGYTATFESLMPWALSDLKTQNLKNGTATTITINTDDEESPIYPKILITNGSTTSKEDVTTTITITRTFDGEEIKSEIKNVHHDEVITLDGSNRVISSVRSDSDLPRVFGDDFNFVWIPLIKGENTIKIEGITTGGSASMQWREPIKIGEF